MTIPRQVLPGSTYLITRRCTQRQFWLKPSKLTNQIVAYCVAHAAELTGVQVHAVCVMSNHWHAVVTDPSARLPEFLHWVHKYVAKCINAAYGRWENLWASEPPSAVRLEGDEDVLQKVAYTLANPVISGLVERSETWPGLRSAPSDLAGRTLEVERPPVFFRENGTMPKSATLQITRPAIYPGHGDQDLVKLVRSAVASREAAVRAAFAQEGRRFLGASAVRSQRACDQPASKEPRRRLNPRIASRDKWRRIEALRRVQGFLVEYRDAYQKWKRGLRDVVFPLGCYAMRVHQGVVVAVPA